MKSIVVSNRKGGTAKSTTALNLAAQLAQSYDVLLIDFDTQGHVSLGVGQNPSLGLGSHSIFSGRSLSETFHPTMVDTLTISPSLKLFDLHENSDMSGVLKERFEHERISDFFDFCIIDTAPTYDEMLKNALDVADVVVVPVVPHYLGVVGASEMLDSILKVKINGEDGVDFGILPVMFNAHIKEHNEALKRLKELFGEKRLFSSIGLDIELIKEFELRVPAVLKEGRSRGKTDYINFTKELLALINS